MPLDSTTAAQHAGNLSAALTSIVKVRALIRESNAYRLASSSDAVVAVVTSLDNAVFALRHAIGRLHGEV